jgi:5-(carboxyamino)imidazole ribonucleotide synthase
MFRSLGIPTPEFAAVDSQADLVAAVSAIGLPAVLKTRRMGYDGKGQRVLRSAADIASAWATLGGTPLILEAFVPFSREISVLAARSRSGPTVFYPLVENEHREGILHRSLAPAPNVSAATTAAVDTHAARLLDALHYVGVLAIEFFDLNGELLANEMAPRVHNSGHWTMDGAETDQFENHLRAILGWPLGGTEVLGYAAMLNLVGSAPATAEVLSLPGAHMHLYGKQPRPGRKLGHINLRADEAQTLTALVNELEPIIERAAMRS